MCFVGGSWSKGLSHLAKGADEKLAAIAIADLKSPTDASEQAALAARWKQLAEDADEVSRPWCLACAKFWYEKASAGAEGLAKLKYKSELKKLGDVTKER